MASEWCDGYLKLVKDGQPIKGESTDVEYSGLIEIVSFTFGSSQGFSTEKIEDVEDVSGKFKSQTRYQDEPVLDMDNFFNGDEPGFSKEELKGWEGQDLTEEAACKITLTKELDLSSPDLFRAYCSTQDVEHRDVFKTATLYIKKSTGGGRRGNILSKISPRQVFLTFVFSDVVVTSYTLDIGGDAVPKETLSLAFAKCRVEYKPQKAEGILGAAIKGGWDMIDRTAW